MIKYTYFFIIHYKNNFIIQKLLTNLGLAAHCHVNPENRRDCGWKGISAAMCRARGCCYNDRWGASIHCYVPATKGPGPCDVNPEDRKECGVKGISRAQCLTSPRCCFNDKYSAGRAKHCYFKRGFF